MVVGEFTVETDLVVVGGGPAGYSAAFRAAELGVDTTIVDDRAALGGTWLHDGCVLSKDLVHLTRTVRSAADASGLGITFGAPQIDLDTMRSALDSSIVLVAEDLEATCRARGIARVKGRARFDNSRQLSISDSPSTPRVRFRRAVIATGARERVLPGVDLDGPRVMRAAEALRVPEIPGHLLVVGGCTSALELAGIYAVLGSRVTVAQPSAELVPFADNDLVAVLQRRLDATLAQILLGTRVVALHHADDGITVDFAPSEGAAAPEPTRRTFDRVLVACGRQANVEGLGLERTGVALDDRGFVRVDEQLRTTDPRILAVGDVVGDPMLARRAAHHGRIAAEVVAGWAAVSDLRAVPMVIFSDPELAWCGLTEQQAVAVGQEYEVRKTGWGPRGRALGPRGDDGFTKLLYDVDTHLVLGVGIVGTGAAELIGEAALAIEMGAVTTDLALTLHPHPTHSESISTAARRADSDA